MAVVDRRGPFRQPGWYAVQLRSPTGTATALAQNVSEEGALLASHTPRPVGEPIFLSLYIGQTGEPPWILRGHVVRNERNIADPAGLWPHKLAIKFCEPCMGLVESIRATG